MQYRKLTELKKLPNNPRIIRDKQFKTLCDSIRDNQEYFEARPIILSNRTGELVIIAGNQRYEAAKTLKLKEVPTYLIEGLTEAKEREIIIRDNISNGEFDFDILANEWSDLPLVDWGVDLPDDWLKEEEGINSSVSVGGNIELLNNYSVYHPAINKTRSCRFLSVRRFNNDKKNAITAIKNIKTDIDIEIIKAIAGETADLLAQLFGKFIDYNSVCTAAPRGHSLDNNYYFAGLLADRIADKLGIISCELFKPNVKKTRDVHNYKEKEVTLSDNVQGKNIIIFDDIATTGTTIENCCNSLREHNFIIPVVWIYESVALQNNNEALNGAKP
jgi:hypothetical protein